MKRFLLFAVLLTAMVLNLHAAKVYFKTTAATSFWPNDGAKIGALFKVGTDPLDFGMYADFFTLVPGTTDTYEGTVPENAEPFVAVQFLRYNSAATNPDEMNYWNGTGLMTWDGVNDMFTATAYGDTWDSTTGTWSKYVPKPDYHDFLHFVGLNGNDTVRLNKYASSDKDLSTLTATFEYSKDRKTWTPYDTWATEANPAKTYQGTAIALAKGDTVFFRAKGTNGKNATLSTHNSESYYNFVFGTNDSIAAGGNIMSLYDASCKQDTMTDYGFSWLFKEAKQLVSAPKLPATTLAKYCYTYMFNGCTSLTTAPELKATTLITCCYANMFKGCKSLTKAPELNATNLAKYCYQSMFDGCTSLTKAPELKATTLAKACYRDMFNGCTSLEVDTCLNDAQCKGALLAVPDTASAPTNWNLNMFAGCKGAYANNIQLNGHYCIKEFFPIKIGDKSYNSFAEAVAAVNAGDTIKLGQETNDTVPLNLPDKKFYIDLAGNNYNTTKIVTVNDSLVVIDSVAGSQAKFTADSLAVTDKAEVSGPVVSKKTSLTQNADLTKGTDLTTGNPLRIMDFKLTDGAQLTTNGGNENINAVEVLQGGKLLLSGTNTLLKNTKESDVHNYGTIDLKDGATLDVKEDLYNKGIMNVKGATLDGGVVTQLLNDSIMNFEGNNTINANFGVKNLEGGIMTFKNGITSITLDGLYNGFGATMNIESDAKVIIDNNPFSNSGKANIFGELQAPSIRNTDSLIVNGSTLTATTSGITNNKFMELTKATLNSGSEAIVNTGIMNLKSGNNLITTTSTLGLYNYENAVLNIEKDATLSFTSQMTITNQGMVNLKGGRILSGNAGETGIVNSATLNLESGSIDCPVVNQAGASIIWKLGQDSIDLKYDKLSNSGKLVINIDSIQKSMLNAGIKKVVYPIASGDFSNLTGKDTFIFVGDGIDSTEIKVNGDTVMCGDRNFALAVRNDSLVFILCPDNVVLDESTVTVDDIKAIKGKKGNIRIKRAFIRDGEYNTICLPFSLDAAQLAQSPLAGYTKLLEFTSAKVKNYGKSDETLVINMSETDAIQAGHPYIIEWDSIGDTIANPVFKNVTVTTEYATNKAQLDGAIMFFGTFTPFMVYENDMDFIFVDEKSQLSWPNRTNLFKAFRAYFQINKANPAGLRSGMNAIFGSDDEEGTTRVLDLNSNDDASKARKLMLEGRVVIERNGRFFDMTGTELK